jgi:hypothetical protein
MQITSTPMKLRYELHAAGSAVGVGWSKLLLMVTLIERQLET